MSDLPELITDRTDVQDTINVAFVGFTILIWDHLDTFPTEVEYIWPRIGEKQPIVYLFLIASKTPFFHLHYVSSAYLQNRYLTPLGFIVNLFAFLSPSMNSNLERYVFEKCSVDAVLHGHHLRLRCKHFVRFEGAMTMIGINVVGLMMLVRIYALYNRQPWVVRAVAALLVTEIGTYIWLMTTGMAVEHNPGVTSCTMIFAEPNRVASSASAWLPLLYDTVVLVLTLKKTLPSIRSKNRHQSTMYLLKRLLEDGLLYYSAIFAVTLALTVMISVAPPGLKNIVAQSAGTFDYGNDDVPNHSESHEIAREISEACAIIEPYAPRIIPFRPSAPATALSTAISSNSIEWPFSYSAIFHK
ncbi:hypothetical protein D9757_007155 [Collybiopsis confluens]|uniref:DUF6533 domain-containing protein n=1 Tax=Collybiopsis confluens TaxID=2823264 RepID=A0A8H5HCH2_9AGAR|nr:hypothetical protein D9757_007155 [Collybiopsis confluens]